MAVETGKMVAEKEIKKIASKAEINEAYFVGILWSNPKEYYTEYKNLVAQDDFIHSVWGFYFELGRRMYEDANIKSFDIISASKYAKYIDVEKSFDEYGGMKTITDVVEIIKDYTDNVEHYYEEIKKNYTIRQLYSLFGERVFIKTKVYNYENYNREQLTNYWQDRLNKLSLDTNVSNYEAENLYISGKEFIKKLKEDSAEMLPFYKSTLMNSITQGVARGHVFMWGGFGNSGKSSIMSEKFVMSCVANGEKCLLILNEEDAQAFRQKIVLSILNHEYGKVIDRKRMLNNTLTKEDEELIELAFERMYALMDGDEAQIKVIFMERYVMKDLEKIVRYWANRGYVNLVIDTHKVSDDSNHNARWETFVEDMKTIYRLTRKNAGGCNLRTWVNFQLADSAIKLRYLTFDAMAEGKGAKNEASVVQMFRPVWSDEYEGGKNELDCYKLVKRANGDGYDKKFFKLEKGEPYYLLFTPKNRFGANNDNGQAVMVIKPAFHKNAFYEIGWTYVAKDFN